MKLKNKIVCVTGGAGFLGSNLCRKLVEVNNKVIIIDNFSLGSMDNLKGIENDVEIITADIRFPETIKDAIKRSEIIYHFAAISNLNICRKQIELAYDINVNGTANVLSLCSDAERVFFSSSITIYGNTNNIPVDEESKLDPLDPYSFTKVAGEYIVKMYSSQYNIPFVITRNCNIFGPYQKIDFLIPTLITQGLKDKEIQIWDPRPVRDYLFVDDAVPAFIRMVESEAAKNEVFNLGSGSCFSSGELAEIISNLLGVRWVDIKKPQPVSPKLATETKKINALTGWKSEYNIMTGLENTIEYFKREVQ